MQDKHFPNAAPSFALGCAWAKGLAGGLHRFAIPRQAERSVFRGAEGPLGLPYQAQTAPKRAPGGYGWDDWGAGLKACLERFPRRGKGPQPPDLTSPKAKSPCRTSFRPEGPRRWATPAERPVLCRFRGMQGTQIQWRRSLEHGMPTPAQQPCFALLKLINFL